METNSRRRKKTKGGYFSQFGLRQFCDILMLLSAIVVIIGLAVFKKTNIVLAIGMIMFIVGSLLAIFRSIKIMTSGINKRSPEYKAALVNVIIMSLLVIAAIIGLILCF